MRFFYRLTALDLSSLSLLEPGLQRPASSMDRMPDYGSGGSRFESWVGRIFFPSPLIFTHPCIDREREKVGRADLKVKHNEEPSAAFGDSSVRFLVVKLEARKIHTCVSLGTRGLSWCHSEKRKVCLEDVGIEPTAFRMQSGRSTTELNSQVQCNGNRRIELGLICLRQAGSAIRAP